MNTGKQPQAVKGTISARENSNQSGIYTENRGEYTVFSGGGSGTSKVVGV